MKMRVKLDFFESGVVFFFLVVGCYLNYRISCLLHLRGVEPIAAAIKDARVEIMAVVAVTMVIVFVMGRKLLRSFTQRLEKATVILQKILAGEVMAPGDDLAADELTQLLHLCQTRIKSQNIGEMLFLTVSETIGEGILLHRGGCSLMMNRALAQMLGRPSTRVTLQDGILKFIDPESHETFVENEKKKYDGAYRIDLCKSDGKKLPVKVRTVPVMLMDGPAMLALFTDVTAELNLAEERTILGQRMARTKQRSILENIGIGIGYELSGPIGVIHGFTEVLIGGLTADNLKKEQAGIALQKIRRQAQRIIAILQHIKQLHRELAFERRQRVDPQKLMDVSLMLFHELFKEHSIDLRTTIGPDLPSFWACPVKIEIALQHILKNAIEALDAVTRPVKVVEFTMYEAESKAIRIEVKDNGPGIREEDIPRLSEPFFTTKDQSKFAGLGLTIAYSIMHELGGKLLCSSVLGGGAVFSLELPFDPRTKERTGA